MTMGVAQGIGAQESRITAIDIVLEPDRTMAGYAEAANATLLRNFPKGFALDATHHYYILLGPIGLAGIVIGPTADLLRLQQELIDAVAHFTVKTATSAAFYTTPEEPDINPAVIEAVSAFSDHTGENFSPHVTIGLARKPFSMSCWPNPSPPSPSRPRPPRSISSVITARRASG